MIARRISDHGLIGDGRSAALVARDGTIDWLCWPRFDSPSVLGALVDPQQGGEWRIGVPGARTTHRYVDGTNVLVTSFETADGEVELTDAMPVATEEDKRHMLVPQHEIVRRVRCTRGVVRVEMHFAPRPDYGRVRPTFRAAPLGGWCFDHRGTRFLLRTTFPLDPHADGLVAELRMSAGEIQYASFSAHSEPAVVPPLGGWTERRLEQTVDYWRAWVAKSTYTGPYRAAVERSALVLALLCFAPSGAIIAAPTTSLPEVPGGDANWDYRYCWLRDAAFTVRALLAVGHREEALAFTSWLLHATRLTRPRLRMFYDVFGRPARRERSLHHLAGYDGARPVRIGNAADDQLQLDTYGALVHAVDLVHQHDDAVLDHETSALLRDVGRFVCRSWELPDRGIWELRGNPRPFTQSRVACWVALDRLLSLEARGRLRVRLPTARFGENRERIRTDVETRGYSSRLASYTQVIGGDTLDASLLLLGWTGFHGLHDERLVSTVERLRTRLDAGRGLLYRTEESRSVGEGAFVACSFWLVEHLASAGAQEADAMFRSLLDQANDLGLYAEEIDPRDGSALGNFPQAYSHVGLISAAVALSAAAEEKRDARATAQGGRP